MFDRIGHAIARRPHFFVLGWVLLLVLGATSALWGFGQGNLFARMQSSESMVPNTESDIVIQKTNADTAPDSSVIVVQGVDAADVSTQIADFREQLTSISGVTDVVDPLSVEEQFTEGIQRATDDAVAQALEQNQATIDRAVQQALAQAEPQIQQAVDGAVAQFSQQYPGAPTDEVAAQTRAQASAQVEQQARETATAQIEQGARQAVAEEMAKQDNPANALRKDGGFVVSVEAAEDSSPTDDVLAATATFEKEIQKVNPDAHADVSSSAVFESAIMEVVKSDLITGEAVGLPIALFLLVVVFGGLIAAGMPLIGALTSIATGMGLLWVLTHVTNVDSFVLNIISVIGMALSIDYGLLIVSRYREEVTEQLERRGLDPHALPDDVSGVVTDAVAATVATAGRTVSFSALTIAFAISGLAVMEAPMLKMI
ncbi:MMPL family transporter, partial [Trueperella bernardiae]|uniref:MMPL family transporter n=1 Tax=Trueperella bernardiae TaxID=59561 RepID=UPI002889D391